MKNNFKYQWEKYIENQTPKLDISKWKSNFGYNILKRDKNNNPIKIEFNLYVEDKNKEVYLIGDFNDWNDDLLEIEKYKLKIDEFGFGKVIITQIEHKSKYKYLVIEDLELKYFPDPATTYFDDFGNSIFWDFENIDSYKQKKNFIDTINRSTKILQTDLPGLINKFKDENTQKFGGEINSKDYFNFITNSKIIEKIKNMGFNTIQFLPFAQSIDGDNWKFRYLVPFQFAIQKNWGTPDEFSKMIDKFHEMDIAVIGDFVIGHIPYKDYKIFGQDCKDFGLHVFKKQDNSYTYLKEKTSWGTIRPDIDNKYIRDFFISTCIFFMKNYKIDGFRIDNVDGILRYGENGEGDEKENGRHFLRELNEKIYDYNPNALIHFEAHYFHGDNAKMLVIPFDEDYRALGATAYNESRLTHYFHETYMLKTAKEVSLWKFKHLIDEKTWGQSNSTVSDFHNHDAAAGLMQMRCTGSYAYDAMIVNREENSSHAIGKIKVMEAIISLIQEGRTLDLLQTHILQRGTFEHDSTIHWNLIKNPTSKDVLDFKININKLMDESAFWPKYVKNRSFLNLDEKNKILVVEKFSKEDEKFVIVINISSNKSYNYKIPVKTKNNFKLILNSQNENINKIFQNNYSNNFELINREIEINPIFPYQILVFKEIND